MPRGDDWLGRPVPVLIFDLDGTVLRVNSFPHWVLFLICGPIRGIGLFRRMRLARRAAWLLLLRKLRRIDHAALLGGLQRAWWEIPTAITGALVDPLQTMLLRRIRPNLRTLLQMVASDRVDAVLATAAAGEYANGLGRRLGFRHVLATPPAAAGGLINAGACKRDRVIAFLESAGWRDRQLILLTDHIDDLPLMRRSALVCWFGPPRRGQEACAAAGGVHLVVCRQLGARAVLHEIETFAASLPQAAHVSAMTAS
jgi:phosphoserine phosphatase